jgi:enamine deaminase RidA (YjgF/YER057c/UK114 family)
MRHFLGRSSIYALCLFVAGAIGAPLVAQVAGPFKVITVDNKPAGPVSSSGILTGKTLYIAAQDGRNADGAVPSDFQQEAMQSLNNVQDVLKAAGMDFGNATWMIVYLVHAADIDKMNDVYWKMIGSNPPARTVLVVGALPNGENIQINCIAVSSDAKRTVIHPAGWPQGPHIDPAGIQADDVLYISAQSGADPATGKIPADMAAEAKQALDNVDTVLKAANMTIANVVWVNPFLNSGQAQMNQVYGAAFNFEFGHTPGRGTTAVVDLPNSEHVVFSVIAGADLSKLKAVETINMAPSPTASPGVLYDDTLYLSGKSGSWEMPVGGGGGARGRRGSGAAGAAGGGAAARGGRSGGGGEAMPDLDTQVRLSLRNLYDGLLVANMTFASVVSYTDYLRDIKDADEVQNVVANYWAKDHIPARTTFQETLDTTARGAEQISVIAVLQPQQ